MAYNNLSYVNNELYVTSASGNSPDTQNLNTGATIGYAKINPSINFQETSTPTLHNHVSHMVNGGVLPAGGSVSIPQYLNGWYYYDGSDYVDFTNEGTILSGAVVELFDPSTHNLNLYAKWGDTKVVRVIIFEETENFLISKPYGDVSMTSSGSYSASGGDSARNLPNTFKNVIDYSGYFWFNYNGNYEYGVGDGCQKRVSGTLKNSYFAIKNGTDFAFSLSNLLAKNYNNNVTHDWYSLPVDKLTGEPIMFYQDSLTSVWDYENGTWYTKVLSESSGTYTCTFQNVSTDITIYVPYQPKLRIRIEASTDPNNIGGTVAITPTETIGDGPGTTAMAYAMPDDSITLTATIPNGYAFDGWYLNSGLTPVSSSTTYTFLAPQVSAGTQSYVAKYITTQYNISYHKQVVQS